jgi:hypothetical protein
VHPADVADTLERLPSDGRERDDRVAEVIRGLRGHQQQQGNDGNGVRHRPPA